MRIIALYLIVSFRCILCRDAIQFFIAHKKVNQASIEVLENVGNSTKIWLEYKYVFATEDDSVLNTTLKVGVFAKTALTFDFLDCRMSTIDNQTVTKGYSIDIIENLRETLNISTEFKVINNLTHLINNKIDLVICHPHIENLPSNVTELYPIIKSNLILVYKPSKLRFTKDIFILTFAGSLWLVFFAIMILLAVCLRISTRKYSTMRPTYESWTWVEITLWAIAAACQQGLSHTPSGFASCLIFFLGYLMAYLLYTGFAAAITSILVENVETNANLQNLRSDKLHLISPECVRSEIKHFKERFLVTEYVNDLNGLFEKLSINDRIGVGPEISIQQYMVNNLSLDEILSFQTMKLNVRYTQGFLTLRNNSWKKIINRHVIALNEFGILQKILKTNLQPVSTLNLNAGYSSAGREHVGSAILLFLGGVLIALLFLVSEFVFYFYKRGRNHITK
ncbi:uncharacterized protein LOC123014905 [Tribolium madens]|uniref:uncharacterized protein LOC123014905 n=1 Tax=Tribolium madens TaxID=41895 RepID=UPI001CF7486B|nr:uncharacterized protein LOC123014905 [Tribolium madens]